MAIMDACALVLVGVERVRPLQARMTFATARQVHAGDGPLAGGVRRRPAPASRASSERRLRPMFCHGSPSAGSLGTAGRRRRRRWPAVRATYEPLALALGDYLLIHARSLDAGGHRQRPDHWQRGARGIIARKLVEGLADGSISAQTAHHRGAPAPTLARGADRTRDARRSALNSLRVANMPTEAAAITAVASHPTVFRPA